MSVVNHVRRHGLVNSVIEPLVVVVRLFIYILVSFCLHKFVPSPINVFRLLFASWLFVCRKALEQEKEADTFWPSEVNPGLKDTIAASESARKLLSGLYQAFPVPLRAIWKGSKGQKSATPDLPLPTEEHSAMERRFGQVCSYLRLSNERLQK